MPEKKTSGAAERDKLDERVEYWHTHHTGVTLREFLGMTPKEYEKWMKNSVTKITRHPFS